MRDSGIFVVLARDEIRNINGGKMEQQDRCEE